MKIPIKSLLFAILIIAATTAADLGLNLLDQIVHGKLYSYGLQFSYEWASPYWTILRIIQILLGFIATLTLANTVYIYRKYAAQQTPNKTLLFSIPILASTVIIAYAITRLDQIVNGQLYSFGLQFSYEWASPYWTTLGTIQFSLGTTATLTVANIIYLYTKHVQMGQMQALKLKSLIKLPKPPHLIGILLFLVGASSIISSIIYTSSILAFIGLGLTFWGALLLYITPVRYVRKDLLSSSLISSLSAMDALLNELDYQGNGIYMPPATLKEIRGGAVFVPATNSTDIPSSEELAEGKVILKNPNGIRLVPPGLQITNLLETEMKTEFTKVDLDYLQNNLAKALIEDLETVEDFEMETNNNTVHIKMTRPIYADLYKQEKLQNVCQRVGCPLCSAIAIILTRTTGKPTRIQKIQFNKEENIVEADYQILEA